MAPAIRQANVPDSDKSPALTAIEALTARLEKQFSKQIVIQPNLTRQLVSFQANKDLPGYRWYKYKEAFSSSLVEYFTNNLGIPRMVKGYFYEMACLIAECSGVLAPRGVIIMVNDNVRYAGASMAVDPIFV